MNGPLKWFGGKHYLAKRIVELMPPHTHYVEPFFGGGAVLWAKDPEGVSEVVNDVYGRLMNFYRHLADPELFKSFYGKVSLLPFSQELWNASRTNDLDDHLNDAVKFFILNRQSRAGQMKDFATLSRKRTRRGMNEQVSAWLGCIDGLPEVHERLQRVVILNDDAKLVIHRQDERGTLFYLDPPYLHETRTSSKDYLHEMTTRDHAEILDMINQCRGKVILSGYQNTLYKQYLCNWNRVDIEIDNKAAGGHTKRKMTESLWMNF